MGDGIVSELKSQAKAAMVMVGLAIFAVLGIVILGILNTSLPVASQTAQVNTTITAFVAGLALFGTFASLTALIIVVKAIIGVVKNLN